MESTRLFRNMFGTVEDRDILLPGEDPYYSERLHWGVLAQPLYETVVFSLALWGTLTGLDSNLAVAALLFALANAIVVLGAGSRLATRLATDPFLNPSRQANNTAYVIGALIIVSFLTLTGRPWVGAWAIVIIIGRLAGFILRWHSFERRYITNRRVIEAGGLFTSRLSSMPLSRVTDIAYTQTTAGLLFGYGLMRVETAGDDQALGIIHYINKPEKFRDQLISLSAPVVDQGHVPPASPHDFPLPEQQTHHHRRGGAPFDDDRRGDPRARRPTRDQPGREHTYDRERDPYDDRFDDDFDEYGD